MENARTQSDAVNGLRLFCNILVVVFHAAMFPASICMNKEKQFLDSVAKIAWWGSIPVLFVISGWCYFNGFKRVGVAWWTHKLTNRIWRLLLPFILWGAFFTALYCAIGNLSPRVAERLQEHHVVGLDGYLRMVFKADGYLLYGPLWFLRALLACALISPLMGWVFMIFRRSFLLQLICLGIISIVAYAIGLTFRAIGWVQYPGYGFVCFGVGAWMAVNGSILVCLSKCFAPFAALGSNRWVQKWLLPVGMFLYLTHLFVNRVVHYSLWRFVDGGVGQLSAIFVASLVISAGAPIVLWHLMNHYCPRVLAVLDGRGNQL